MFCQSSFDYWSCAGKNEFLLIYASKLTQAHQKKEASMSLSIFTVFFNQIAKYLLTVLTVCLSDPDDHVISAYFPCFICK